MANLVGGARVTRAGVTKKATVDDTPDSPHIPNLRSMPGGTLRARPSLGTGKVAELAEDGKVRLILKLAANSIFAFPDKQKQE